MWRPEAESARPTTVAPGHFAFSGGQESYDVVWWDPHVLALDAGSPFGLRRDDLIAKDGDADGSARRLDAYRQWQSARASAIAGGKVPSVSSRTVTQLALERELPLIDATGIEIDVVDIPRVAGRPHGALFGTLVHATLATVPLTADEATVKRVARTHGRILLGSTDGVEDEAYAAGEVVAAVLRHSLFDRVRAADAAKRCSRELPIIWKAPDGSLIEGTMDLVFEDGSELYVLDFKTDREVDLDVERYRRQLAIYCKALAGLKKKPTRGILMRI